MAVQETSYYTTGYALYLMVYRSDPANGAFQVYDNTDDFFEAFSGSGYSDYPITATELSTSGLYVATIPEELLVAGAAYTFEWRRRVGASPALTDPRTEAYDVMYDATIMRFVPLVPSSARLDTRLTTARAANLDNLDAAISDVNDNATAAATSAASVDGKLTNARALKLDNLETTPDTRDLAPTDHTWTLRRSGTGTWRSTNKCVVSPGDTVRIAWDCTPPGILPGGTVISTQGTPTLVDPSDDITITAIGHDATHAKVEIAVAADAAAGTHWIKTAVTPDGASGPKYVYGEVEVQAEP